MTKERRRRSATRRRSRDLKGKESKLSITGFPECKQRQDCLLGVEDTYGLKFGKFVSSEQKYQVLDSGDADVAFIFTTDGDLAGGKYVVLDDDKKFFPPYNVTFNVRNEALKNLGPEGQKVIEDVQKPLTEKVMQELNARVDIDKKKPEEVGRRVPPAGRLHQVVRREIPAPAVWWARDNRGRMLRRVAAPLVLVLLLAGCGGGGDESTESSKATPSTAPAPKLIRRNPANASTTLTIGSKNFTEEFILGEIYAQALKAGGYKVRKQLDYGSELVAFKGVRDGKLDAYPEYTGTALTTFFDVEPTRSRRTSRRPTRPAQERLRQERGDRAPADALHGLQRGRHDARARRGAGRRRRSPTSRSTRPS